MAEGEAIDFAAVGLSVFAAGSGGDRVGVERSEGEIHGAVEVEQGAPQAAPTRTVLCAAGAGASAFGLIGCQRGVGEGEAAEHVEDGAPQAGPTPPAARAGPACSRVDASL